MSRQETNPYKYLAVFSVTILIFVAGFFVGDYVNQIKINELDKKANNIRSSVLGMELQQRLLSENPCQAVNSSRYTRDLGEISQKLTFMEDQLGPNNPRVLNLKEYYSMLEVRHWLFLEEAQEKCDRDYSLVLYFYSNKEGECEMCDEQGEVLSYVHDQAPHFNIYSFDVNIDNPALNSLKELHDVNKTPALVINGTTYRGFVSKQRLIRLLELPRSRFDIFN